MRLPIKLTLLFILISLSVEVLAQLKQRPSYIVQVGYGSSNFLIQNEGEGRYSNASKEMLGTLSFGGAIELAFGKNLNLGAAINYVGYANRYPRHIYYNYTVSSPIDPRKGFITPNPDNRKIVQRASFVSFPVYATYALSLNRKNSLRVMSGLNFNFMARSNEYGEFPGNDGPGTRKWESEETNWFHLGYQIGISLKRQINSWNLIELGPELSHALTHFKMEEGYRRQDDGQEHKIFPVRISLSLRYIFSPRNTEQ